MKPAQYAKAIAAFLASAATWGGTAIADDHIDGVEWFGLLGVAAATLLTYFVTNAPKDDVVVVP